MKTNVEIEKLARIYENYNPNDSEIAQAESGGCYHGYKKGYTQCQQDMADKKYTELQLRFFANELIKGVEEKNKQGYEDIKVDYESLILSLNKQEDAKQELENRMNINRILKGY